MNSDKWRTIDDDTQGLTPERWQRQTICVMKEEEDPPVLKIAWLHQYEDSGTSLKRVKKD